MIILNLPLAGKFYKNPKLIQKMTMRAALVVNKQKFNNKQDYTPIINIVWLIDLFNRLLLISLFFYVRSLHF